MFKQFLLAAVLIAVPVAAFSAGYVYLAPPAEDTQASLGDLSPLKSIAMDVQSIAAKGDLVAAEKRITDFETLWDQDEAAMRPLNQDAWGTVDDAADAAIHALRASSPDQAKVANAVKDLIATLDNPYGNGSTGSASGPKMVKGIAVTDESGHPLACEEMIKALRAAIDAGKVPSGSADAAQSFVSQAVERCNADDDANANNFSAQGLALASQG